MNGDWDVQVSDTTKDERITKAGNKKIIKALKSVNFREEIISNT